MGNCRMQHCHSDVNTTPPIMSKTTIVQTQKQHARIGVTQSFGAGITTIGMETVVAPNINVVRRGVLIGSATKLGNGSSGISVIRNLNQSLALPTTTNGVVDILQMVFTNLIIMIHVNMTIDRPLMSSMVV